MGEAITEVEAFSLDVGDGTHLSLERTGVEKPKGVVVVVHGYGDHQGRYREVRDSLLKADFVVWTFDYRGHGRSAGKRGHIESFDEYLTDLASVLRRLEDDPRDGGLPRFLLGHSQGGCIALMHTIKNDAGLAGVAVSAPMLGLRIPVPMAKVAMARMLSKLAPAFSMPSGLKGDDLTHDPEAIRLWQSDPLVGRVATARWFTEAARAMRWVMEQAAGLSCPFLCMIAGADPVVSPSEARKFFKKAGSEDKEIREYPNFFHELFNEVDKDRVFDDLIRWLQARIKPNG